MDVLTPSDNNNNNNNTYPTVYLLASSIATEATTALQRYGGSITTLSPLRVLYHTPKSSHTKSSNNTDTIRYDTIAEPTLFK
mmetsp:Transcript_49200/g.54801  ORF Transcript_49200/g.54801 Transcript_49200/m.54801 type:complete len:82 (-) Transcript_49200:102-347(-)